MLDLKKGKQTADRVEFRGWAGMLLSNWKSMNSGSPYLDQLSKKWPHTLGACDIDQVRGLIAYELQTKQRVPILERLVTRYSKLEAAENMRTAMRQLAIYSTGGSEP